MVNMTGIDKMTTMKRRVFLLFFCAVCIAWTQDGFQNDRQMESFNALRELSQSQLSLANGKNINGMSVVSNKKFIALYFSAHWCGPCRAFTPELVKFRNKCVQKNLPFEVVFISSDKSKDEMNAYMTGENMKWPAVPYSSPLRGEMQRNFRVNGIPALVLLDSKGNVFSRDARWDVQILGIDAYKRWLSPQYKPLTYDDLKKKDVNTNSEGKKNGRSKKSSGSKDSGKRK